MGGRKPLKPENRSSEIIAVRVRPDVRKKLEQLAAKNNRKLSREIQRMFEQYVNRPQHDGGLSDIIAQMGQLVELAQDKAESESKSWRRYRRTKHTLKFRKGK